MNFRQFKNEVAAVMQGHIPSDVANVDRTLRKKELLQCAQALNLFAARCLESPTRGERSRRLTPLSGQLPPVV